MLIPHNATAGRAVGGMPSPRGGFMPDPIIELHNYER